MQQTAEIVELYKDKKLTCCKCGLDKPIWEFNKNNGKKRGFTYRCRDCISLSHRRGRKPYTPERSKQVSDQMKLRHAIAREPVLKLIAEKQKTCTKCKQIKPLSRFTKDKSQPCGCRASCKDCNRAYYNKKARDYFSANKEKISQKSIWYRRKSEFGLTREKYYELLAHQNNACAICKITTKEMRVDHNHATKELRGLLCHKCNSGIGLLGDSITVLKNAIEYLEKRGSYGKA